MRLELIAAFLIPVLAIAQNTAPGRCAGNPQPFSPGAGDWNGWGVDAVNSRFQPQPGLAAEDVPRLKLKWAFGFPGEARTQSQAVIVGGRVFVGTTAGTVYSLDAATGCIYWTYDAGAFVKSAISIVRTRIPARWMAYFGDGRGFAHGVDAQTGRPVWKVQVEEHPAARITGSPMYYNGRLYVPVASGEETLQSSSPKYECCKFRGSLSAIDASTGRVYWKTFTVPDPAKPYKTNSEGTTLYGPAGAGIWSAPTIDEKRKRIYVGTGNSYTGVGMPTSDAILAFDLDSGSLLWSQQVTPNDNWVPGCPKSVNCPENPGDDFDFGSSPVLRPGADGKQVLVAAQKSGVVYGLDPDDRGKVLWKTRIGVGNGMLGGVGWGPAFDGQLAYAAVADINRPQGTPGLYALKVDGGDVVWSTPAPQGAGIRAQAAAVSAIPGVAFSGSFGGHLRAYSTKTGGIVWDFDALREFETVNHVPAKGGSFDGGGPAIAHGLVVTNCGYGFGGGIAGNVLLAFSVDGK
ncbi:MAG TPA: PQQ-binding-like beta-propeller repeat protein [Bryobacteraceae bacterium]|jgi:polyvinyl alcohol dehydrogenase (cytochrome)|nr:PQQ-binding-like beta-propeller repeat protein [Bryobacteraceae bacterium]